MNPAKFGFIHRFDGMFEDKCLAYERELGGPAHRSDRKVKREKEGPNLSPVLG